MDVPLPSHRQHGGYGRVLLQPKIVILKAAKRFICKACGYVMDDQDCITIDGSQTNRMAIIQCDTESQLKGQAAAGRIAIR